MVWSSPSMTQPTSASPPDGQGALSNSWSSDSRYDISNLVTPDPMSPPIPPVRELQRPSYPMSDGSRPSTADSFLSFVTSSSDLIITRNPPVSSDSMSPAISPIIPPVAYSSGEDHRPSTADSFSTFSTSSSDLIFTRNHPFGSSTTTQLFSSESSPVGHALPSPPQYHFSTQPVEGSGTSRSIPSAQPYTPSQPLDSQGFSVSESSSMLPSPPLTQPREGDDSWDYSTQPNSSRSVELYPVVGHSHFSNQSHSVASSEPDDSELLASVLDGIARIHVTMGRDQAGRWRIRRTGNEES
ncbi:hypothetical protein BGZ61DRAFT_169262 [Ilyonectria robusta]|uniref:uncharacterized protein n=1 Tax=Ilyonectria robusta TaxID=1079257 RepID=UPI001E8CF1AF|nr:uncharacterized protein BGZ61DRAFT_169262 [Ilyonectria robusta]KAH8734013.1 hypothetical protein BGZ61DRAFT_169262 [Ilyonectria robusta]